MALTQREEIFYGGSDTMEKKRAGHTINDIENLPEGKRAELIDDKGCHGAPDLAVEVVSDSSARMDYAIKLFKYHAAGVKEYWIVDYNKNRIQVYDLECDNMTEYTFDDTVPVGIYQGKVKLNFKEM